MPHYEPRAYRWVRFKINGQDGWTAWEPADVSAAGIMLIGDDMPWPLKPLGRTELGSLEDIEIGGLIIPPKPHIAPEPPPRPKHSMERG